jgi:hypothetical protein
MFLRNFSELFPEMARKETRVLMVVRDPVLPEDEYALVEFYCEDPRCECRNVQLRILAREQGWVATVNHAFEPDGFRDIGLPQTFLDPTCKQSPFSEYLLELTTELLADPAYAERLERHYNIVKNRGRQCLRPQQSASKLQRKLLRKAGRR